MKTKNSVITSLLVIGKLKEPIAIDYVKPLLTLIFQLSKESLGQHLDST